MKIIFWVKGNRGVSCLRKVLENSYCIDSLVLQQQHDKEWYLEALRIGKKYGIAVFEPEDPNSHQTEEFLKRRLPDLFILAGYGKIVKQNIIDIPKLMCINLHGGKLPEYRGSSPMNWALINGESEFGISIIKVDTGVDTGAVIMDRLFTIDDNSTIYDLHKIADDAFPQMLLKVLEQLKDGSYSMRKQDPSGAAYYPLRFPDDGLVLWDMMTAQDVHNRIRALTVPYPCAFTYYQGRKVRLVSSTLKETEFFGEPGRVYQKKEGKLLVYAKDKCLWITKAVFEDTGESLYQQIARYERLATVMGSVGHLYKSLGDSI